MEIKNEYPDVSNTDRIGNAYWTYLNDHRRVVHELVERRLIIKQVITIPKQTHGDNRTIIILVKWPDQPKPVRKFPNISSGTRCCNIYTGFNQNEMLRDLEKAGLKVLEKRMVKMDTCEKWEIIADFA
jgi:hypothetical protein